MAEDERGRDDALIERGAAPAGAGQGADGRDGGARGGTPPNIPPNTPLAPPPAAVPSSAASPGAAAPPGAPPHRGGLVGALERLATTLVRVAIARPLLSVLLLLALGIGAGVHVSRHFAMDTDATRLFPQDLPWRQAERALEEAFPQRNDLVAVVIDGATGAVADRAAAALAEALARRTDIAKRVSRPDGGAFFERNAFLFLPEAEVRSITEQLIAAQPLLGTLAADPGLRGVASTLDLVLEGVKRGDTTLESLAAPLRELAGTAGEAAEGRLRPLDWSRLFTGRAPSALELRRFVLVQARLDYAALSPGEAVTEGIRAEARRLGLDAAHGVRLRITGAIPMGDEEFGSIAEDADVNGLLSVALVVFLLWLALRSVRLVLAVLVTLAAGLAVTAAFALLAVGPFNIISVAFAVLFVGLGVDFGIQYAVRYRAERHALPPGTPRPLRAALLAAGHRAGPAMLLAAIATAIGFLSFLPTDYRGVADLGRIAGFGMVVAVVLSLTLLPALLCLLRPAAEGREVGWSALAPLDRALTKRARLVVGLCVVLAVGGLALLPRLSFDVDPLHLRDRHSEAVATYYDLMRDPDTTPQTADILAPSLDAAEALARRAAALPEIRQAVTLRSFIPENQGPKLALIEDAAMLMGPTLAPEPRPDPDDAAVAAALRHTAEGLAAAAGGRGGAAATDAGRLAVAFRALADGPPEGRALLAEAVVPGLRTTLRQITAALGAQAVTEADLPADLRADWVTPDGRARVELYPSGDSTDDAAMARFAAAAQSLSPGASGPPISILGSTGTIRHAFLVAGGVALALIALLLTVVLRSVTHMALALAPLMLGLLLTLATCVLTGLALNLANIIALPLLLGVGVAFHIYYILAWEDGTRELLATPLTRAVVLSALTTASAFGLLALSHHPGTASMGVLLTLSLAWTLLALLVAMPAMLHVAEKPAAPPAG
ncbi:MMPL family transporter [Roseomonas sp. NAR14]|uniref:MMPL family transporter n=1 Tax=Roseomonas acroporae TaxID=2937791 RepID=A0A9X1Y972_9PROT|nr:MMPL family transporter [Roseomonas acroporae]MCK8786439.1 MMPL family transporter [Roseomonas acroporae]